jgi:Cof subfamily protein (haloacid dehalogenase superfamily)
MKLIFLDIDGTLVPAGTNVPPASALEAIRAAQAAGNKVFLCTGRNYAMLKPLLTYGFDGMVASAGGYVCAEGKVLFDHPMAPELYQETIRLLHKNGIFCTVETRDVTYGDERLGDFLKNACAENSEIERWRRALADKLDIRPLSDYCGEPVYKVVIMCRDARQLQEPEEKLGKYFEFCMQTVPEHDWTVNGELISRAFDKGRGVERIRSFYGVSREDTYGFGDSMNDLAMTRAVGTSACMASGSEELKKNCTLVVPAVDEDGIAKGFKQLGLLK